MAIQASWPELRI